MIFSRRSTSSPPTGEQAKRNYIVNSTRVNIVYDSAYAQSAA
jgi:hypothetical protein